MGFMHHLGAAARIAWAASCLFPFGTAAAGSPDLAVQITDSATSAVPGTPVTYLIRVVNVGPIQSVAIPASVTATFPFATSVTWTCAATSGGTCSASGTGDINDAVTIGQVTGAEIGYVVTAQVDPFAQGLITATAAVSNAGDANLGDNVAIDTDALTPLVVDLAIAVTDGAATAIPGGNVTYTVTASNAGPAGVVGAQVVDTFPAGVSATWTCAPVGPGSSCGSPAGSGSINTLNDIAPAGAVIYTVNASLGSSMTGSLVNGATVSIPAGWTDTNPGNESATDTDILTPQADLAITKTDGVTTAVPGGSVTYTIVANNAGPSDAPGATVADTFPASLTTTWTCSPAGGATCTASGSGNINHSVYLPAGGSVTYTASSNIEAAATGTLINTATVTVPGGVADPNPGNDSATDTDSLAASADLAITVDDGVTTAAPGGSVTYTIKASNAGPSNATGSTVADTFPASLAVTWTCVGAGGGTCTASGSGNISDTVNLPAGGSVTYTAIASVSAAATGLLSNTATVASPGGVTDPTPGNNLATDSDSLLLVSFSGPSATGTGMITATLAGTGACSFTSAQFIGRPPGAPPIPPTAPPGGVQFPQGLFDFTVNGCTVGTAITVSIVYPRPLPPGTQYWKYGPTAADATPHWYILPASIVGNAATFAIIDGGLGDDDLVANGAIIDQGGPGAAATAIPSLHARGLVVLVLLLAATAAAAGSVRRGPRARRGAGAINIGE